MQNHILFILVGILGLYLANPVVAFFLGGRYFIFWYQQRFNAPR